MRKKVLALVLAVCMVLTLLPVTASANAGDTGTKSTKLFTSVKIDDVEIVEASWSSTWNIFSARTAEIIDYSSVKLDVAVVDGAKLKFGIGNTKYPGATGAKVDPSASAYESFKSSFDEVKGSLKAENNFIWILATNDETSELVTVKVNEVAGNAVTDIANTISGSGTYKVTEDINNTITVSASDGDVTLIVPAGRTININTNDKPAISVTGSSNVTITVNGTITGGGEQGVITNSGTSTTVNGTGKITGTSTDPVIVNNGGTLTLKGNLTIENETPKSDSP